MKNQITNNCFVISILIINASVNAFKYPEVRRDETIRDDFWGTKVSDPYRWLEDPDSSETKKFVTQQNSVTNAYLQTNKHRTQITNDFKELYKYSRFGAPFRAGDKYYMTANTESKNQDIYYSFDSYNSNETKVFLDPNLISNDGSASVWYTIFSKDGRYCAYGMTKGGSDWTYVRIRDTQTLEEFPETVSKIKFSQLAWTPDNLGFFYGQYDEFNGTVNGSDSGAVQNEKIYYHRLNTSQSEDIKILSNPGHPHRFLLFAFVDESGQYLHIFPQEDYQIIWQFAKLKLPITEAIEFTSIVDQPKDRYTYLTSDSHSAYAITNLNAPNFKVIKVNMNDYKQSSWVDVVPENKKKVLKSAVAFNKDYLAIVYMVDVIDTIEIYQLSSGKFIRKLNIPIGSIADIQGNINDSKIFFTFTSFTTPNVVYRYDFDEGDQGLKVFRDSNIGHLDLTDIETKELFYQSKDGTVKVPLFLLHKKGIKLDGSNPTLLFGYGGFDVPTQPSYDPLAIFFANNLNGIFALANIRGGGEYGESWHKSGSRMSKQNAFDDFASAAEYLIKNNYTRRDRLSIHGESNGGTLMAVSSNQRPDLFGCAIAAIGVMDMLRYTLFTVGIVWTGEFGNPQTNETEFKYIYRYSPLANIPDNATQYPAILLLTADHDDRVVPAHSYKFTAQLQHTLGTKLPDTPMMIRIDANSGHEGKPVSKQILENTDIVSFILNSLGIDYNHH